MTLTRLLTLGLIGFIFGLTLALLTGCAKDAPLRLYDKDPDRVFFYGQIQFDEARRAFALSEQTLERNDRNWPLLIEQEVPDGTIVCFERLTSARQEDCTTLGTLRDVAQGKR